MKKSQKAAYILLQWSWGLVQSLLGLGLRLVYRRCRRRWMGGALAVFHDGKWGGVSLGMFLFVPEGLDKEKETRLLMHEYGHSRQSLLLGPLYLPLVGLPSFLWANLPALVRYRRRRAIGYYDRYPENWADRLGQKYGEKAAKALDSGQNRRYNVHA